MADLQTNEEVSANAGARRLGDIAVLDHTFEGRRVLTTTDLVADTQLTAKQFTSLVKNQELAATHFYVGLDTLKTHFELLLADSADTLPTQVIGNLTQPDGTPADRLLITALRPASLDMSRPWANPAVTTDDKGHFALSLPAGTPAGGGIQLQIKGAHGLINRQVARADIAVNGVIGTLILADKLDPLPQSIIGSLISILGDSVNAGTNQPAPPPVSAPPKVRIGEDDCEITFDATPSFDRYPYGVLIRLVEPRTSILTQTLNLGLAGQAGNFTNIALRGVWGTLFPARRGFTDRVPVDQPISVDGFRDQIIGNRNGVIGIEETVPMAGTLGLGYVVKMAQKWTPAGHSLGDLVYSLPLAPGEQQKIAIFEQRQTLTTSEFESLEQTQQEFQSQQADSSTSAVFSSAFNESVRGSSSYATSAESSSWGAAGGIGFALGPIAIGGGAAGGGGSAHTNGSANQALDGARNYTSSAAQSVHSSAEHQGFARRSAQRTSIRLASASDSERVTTKVITNNNRAHALTIQYWEVLRHFDVTTDVEGVTLVCFVPVEVVRFLPAGQQLALDPNLIGTRAAILQRYGQLSKHIDILRNWVPRQYRQGLTILEEFAANPNAQPDLKGLQEDIVNISLHGAFLPIETLYVSIVTKNGSRIGPVQMTVSSGTIKPLPDAHVDLPNAFTSKTDLLVELHNRRNSIASVTLTANIVLPRSLAPTDVVGFEITRSFRSLNYSLAPKKADTGLGSILSALQPTNTVINGIGGILSSSLGDLLLGVHLSPQELEQELGGPFVNNFSAVTQTNGVGVPESYATGFLASPIPLPSSSYPIPALQVAPLLRFNDLLKIEQCLQHVVKNTITYSRSVWMSLTPEERVIMLEGYTIGVPAGGIADDTQNIPLLNCISNQVLGYYGNSLIFPFTIPIEVAEKIGFKGEGQDKAVPLTTGAIQQVLGDYHKNGFSPPVSRIALPTHGVLGEAILGHCSSAEKIDLRRFWNWQDSPIPQATDINPVTINRGTGLEAATAANTLTGLPSIINNLTLPSGDSALAQALIAGQDKTPFQNITGGAELATLQGKTLDTAESARAGALAAAQSLATKALEQVPNILSAQAKAKESQKADDAKAQEDQTKKQDAQSKSQDDATTKRNDRLKAAVESLKGNAKTYQDVADAKTNQGEADAFAKSVVKASLGGVDLTADWGAQLFDAYKDGAAHPKGSPAFLAALGLK